MEYTYQIQLIDTVLQDRPDRRDLEPPRQFRHQPHHAANHGRDLKTTCANETLSRHGTMDNEEMERLKAEKLEKAREELRKDPHGEIAGPNAGPRFPATTRRSGAGRIHRRRRKPSADSSGIGPVAARWRRAARPSSPGDLPRKQLKRHHILGKWPLVIWGGVLLLALLVHFGFVRETPADGEVESLSHVLETNEDAVVASLAVSKWETVEAGQELARLSSPELEQSLAEVDAALARRQRELQDGSGSRSSTPRVPSRKAGSRSRGFFRASRRSSRSNSRR